MALTRDEINRISGRSEYRALPAFTDLGGYPVWYITEHGDCLCADCATLMTDYDPIPNSAWDDPIAAVDVYWEGATYYCDSCGKPIESAYGDPWAEESE